MVVLKQKIIPKFSVANQQTFDFLWTNRHLPVSNVLLVLCHIVDHSLCKFLEFIYVSHVAAFLLHTGKKKEDEINQWFIVVFNMSQADSYEDTYRDTL